MSPSGYSRIERDEVSIPGDKLNRLAETNRFSSKLFIAKGRKYISYCFVWSIKRPYLRCNSKSIGSTKKLNWRAFNISIYWGNNLQTIA